MKKFLSGFVFVTVLISSYKLHAQVAPSIQWAKCFGGSDWDQANSIQQTNDGCFIVAGGSYSHDGDVSGHHGDNNHQDFWIIKLDMDGNLIWQKSLGGIGEDQANSIKQTTDSGYIVAGWSHSDSNDVAGNHGSADYWIVKLDAEGYLIWQKCLGGSSVELGQSIQQTFDGGFIVAGSSASNDGDVSESNGSYDYWIVKLDTTGNIIWQNSFGGFDMDIANSIQQTSDSGFIVAGYSASNNGDVTGHYGCNEFYYAECFDYWILKLDKNGNLIWEKSLGGYDGDFANSIQQIADGSFIIAGYSSSNDGDVSGNHIDSNQYYYNSYDYWIVKLSGDGNLIWQKCLGGSLDPWFTGNDWGTCIQQTSDSGFIVSGYSYSNNGDVSGNHGYMDYWIVKLDVNGNLEWQKCLGGSSGDRALSIQQTIDGGYITAGWGASNDSNITGNHGGYDYWIVKLTSDIPTNISSPSTNFISLHPNPVQNLLTITLTMQAANTIIHAYDLQGKIIQLPTTFTNTQAQLNTTTLPNGFYTLQIINNKTGEIEIGKFVKAN